MVFLSEFKTFISLKIKYTSLSDLYLSLRFCATEMKLRVYEPLLDHSLCRLF